MNSVTMLMYVIIIMGGTSSKGENGLSKKWTEAGERLGTCSLVAPSEIERVFILG